MKYSSALLNPSGWSITVRLSVAMLFTALVPMSVVFYSNLAQQNSLNLLIIGAIAVILTIVLAQTLVRPVRLLVKAARSLERGNFTPPALAEVSQNSNDIGYVARLFSQMAARVKAAQEQQIHHQVTEVLLKELNTDDLDWCTTVGHYREIGTGTLLIQEGHKIDAFHVVLDGKLTVTAAKFEGSYLNQIYSQDNALVGWEVAQLGCGEVAGESLCVDAHTTATTTIKASEPSLVLSICQQLLKTKLRQDAGFAARFYRAIAIILSNRLHRLVSQVGCTQLTQDQPLRDVLFVLGALNDSDIDWLVEIGQQQKILANTILIHQGRSVDALYILLNGTLTLSTAEDVCNPFVRAFSVCDAASGPEIARLSKGEIVGETPFLDAHLPPATVTALQDSLVLLIPRSQLTIKLNQDVGFAARFYRVLANLLSNRLQELLNRLGYVEQVETREKSLNGSVESEDELNFNILDQMAIAGTRFDWMLKRLSGAEPV